MFYELVTGGLEKEYKWKKTWENRKGRGHWQRIEGKLEGILEKKNKMSEGRKENNHGRVE